MRMNMSGRGGRIPGGQTHHIKLGSISSKPYKKTKPPMFMYAIPLGLSVAVVLLLAMTDLDAWLAERSSLFETLLYELAYRDALTFIFLLGSFFLGIFCVCFIMYRLVSKHKGETGVSFHTYVDNEFYAAFDTLSSKLSAEDRIYFESQKRIKNNPNHMPPMNTDHLDHLKNDNVNASDDSTNAPSIDVDKEMDESLPDTLNHVDLLDDLPEFDPDGPNPFGKK